jgi:hypothetical protein
MGTFSSSTLPSGPKQIIAGAMICGVDSELTSPQNRGIKMVNSKQTNTELKACFEIFGL